MYVPSSSTVRTKRTVREPEQSEKIAILGIKVAESAIPHRIFWLLWKMAYTMTRDTEMTVAGMGIVQVKRRKK